MGVKGPSKLRCVVDAGVQDALYHRHLCRQTKVLGSCVVCLCLVAKEEIPLLHAQVLWFPQPPCCTLCFSVLVSAISGHWDSACGMRLAPVPTGVISIPQLLKIYCGVSLDSRGGEDGSAWKCWEWQGNYNLVPPLMCCLINGVRGCAIIDQKEHTG